MTLPSITATGRLGDDPALQFTPSGKAVAKFRMACDESRKEDGEWKRIGTTWLAVDQWGDDAETAAEHLKKGDLVTVVGQLVVREYDRKDGTKGQSVEIKYGRISKALPRNKPSGTGAPIQQASSNPWDAAPQPQQGGASWSEEPPF